MARNAFVPMVWITSDINGEALRTLIAISFYADAKTGECWPNNAKLIALLGKTERTIQRDVKALVDAGLISIHDGGGKYRRFRIESPEWYDRPGRKTDRETPNNPDENCRGTDETTPTKNVGVGVAQPRQKTSPNPDNKRRGYPDENCRGPNKNTPIEHTQEHNSGSSSFSEESKPTQNATTTTTKNLEPFEAGIGTELPAVRNAVEPFRPRLVELQPTQFKPETRDRIMSILGHDAEQFARKITQEQADAGFPDWILDEAKRNKTPGRLAFHLLKTAWRPGWINPKAEEQAKRAARRERLRALK